MLIFVKGPNSSGKSRYAERLIESMGYPRYYIATMKPYGDAGKRKVEKHIRQRKHLLMTTVEDPFLERSVIEIPDGSVILLDDLTNLLGNRFFEKGDGAEAVFEEVCRLSERAADLVVVSISGYNENEYDGETKEFIRMINKLNEMTASAAGRVVEMENIEGILGKIKGPDEESVKLAQKRQAKLAKPPGSLGKLEEISIKIAGITGQVKNEIPKKRILVFAADNGIIEEKVSSAPRYVTMTQAVNMTFGKTGMSSMAKHFGDEVNVIDVGIADEYTCPEIIDRKLARGTKNMLREDAMTRDEVTAAMRIGVEMAQKAKEDGVSVIGIGEMGIGNTSTSTCVLCALTGKPVEEFTGRGGGLTDESFQHKKEVLEAVLRERKPDGNDVIGVLAKVGGFDIAAMCGAFLGAAYYRMPVVIDGYISAVAALCAVRLAPLSKEYMFPSHASEEPGYMLAMKEMGLSPWLMLGMRLGEGSGCVVAFQVMEAALSMMNGMALFGEEAKINDSYLDEIREAK